MSDLLELRINDAVYSWASCSFLIAGAPFVGITSINYSEKRDRKVVHAARKDGVGVGMTSGQYDVDGLSITMLRSSFQRLVEVLSVIGLGSYGDARFPIIISVVEPRQAGTVLIAIEGCAITGVKDSNALGSDELTTEVELGCHLANAETACVSTKRHQRAGDLRLAYE